LRLSTRNMDGVRSNRDGTLSVIAEISPETFVSLPPIPTQLGARTMAIDPNSGRIYLVTADMATNESRSACRS